MYLTRRLLITWLAAVLAAVRIPSVSAQAETDVPEDDFDDHEIHYLEVGECEDMLGGPATEAGWYLHPVCMIGCCQSKGPFPSREAAREANRIRYKKLAENARSRNLEDRATEEDLYF
jgi:hypothetical protein